MDTIELPGFEKSPTKDQINSRLIDEMASIETAIKAVEHLENIMARDIKNLILYHDNDCQDLVEQLKDIVKIQSSN